MKNKKYIFLVTMGFLISCGGSQSNSNTGLVSLKISNSRAPAFYANLSLKNLPSPLLVVEKFRVTVTGEGIETPIVGEADGAASEISVLEIPAGPGRSISIDALNSIGDVIRRRKIDDVTISPGVVSPIQTSLNTVPQILNIRNGSIVSPDSFNARCFGEPGSVLTLDARTSEVSPASSENDVIHSLAKITPAMTDGLYQFDSSLDLHGRQIITIKDLNTGEFSKVSVLFVDARHRPGTRLSAAGSSHTSVSLGVAGDEVVHFPKILKNGGDSHE